MRVLLNLALIAAFCIGYMQWGGGNSSYVFQAIYEILFKNPNWIQNFSHPIILSGLVGILCLLYNAFAPKPKKVVQWIGIGALGVVIFFIFLAGALSMNWKQLLSVAPFFSLCFVYFYKYRKAF